MTNTDRLPHDPSSLALLLHEQEQNQAHGEPDPAIAMWDQLKEQEGYDVASPIWTAALNHYDHMFAADDAPTNSN